MENSITVVQKVKYRIAIWSSNFIFRYILKIKRLKEINITQQSPYRIIHNSQKVVTTQMSIKRWMDKQNAVCPHNCILLSHKKEWNSNTCHNMNFENIMYVKKEASTEGQILPDSTYAKHLE